MGAYLPKVIEIEPLALDGQRIPVRAALRLPGALAGRSVPAVVESGSGNWTTAGSGQFTPPTGSYDNDPQSWRAGSTPGINLVTGVNLTVLAGQYNVPLRTQFSTPPRTLPSPPTAAPACNLAIRALTAVA